MIADVFAELATAPRWVAWKQERRGDDLTKLPVNPRTGALAKSNDPTTWGTLEEAEHIVAERGLAGVGIVLGDGLGGIDLDACRDPGTGAITQWARRIVEGFGSYTEISPSGTGLKIYALGAPDQLPAHVIDMGPPAANGAKAPQIEVYTSGRYFAVTGLIYDGSPAELRDCGALADGWDRIVRTLRERAAHSTNGSAPPVGESIATGGRNRALTSLAGTMRRRGMGEPAILAALLEENAIRCVPPLDEGEVRAIARSVGRYEPRDDATGPTPHDRPEVAPEELTLTDTGNAARLVALHGAGLRYVPRWGRWIVAGDDDFWTVDHKDVHVRELAKDVGHQLKLEAADETDNDRAKRLFSFGTASLNARGISGMVDLARGIEGVPLEHEELDADGWVLGVENGVVDLRTGELRPADPGDLITMRCPVPYEAEAEAPRWERAHGEWFPDPEMRSYVHRVAGSALVGAQRDHVFVIHYGLGGNGKGTFTRALQHVLGRYAIEVHLTLLLDTKYREHDTVKADLFRSRLAIAVETDRRVKLAEASVKNLTGGDRIRARRMREDPWSFDPTHSLWLQTNHLPEIGGRDTGIWRRIRVVKWERTFTDSEQDRDLDATLQGEGPGVLRWLVAGCLEWQKHGLQEPEKVVRDTLAYRHAEDTFSRFQADMGIAFDPELEMQAQEIQDLLTEWANGEGIDPPRGEIGDWLHEHGCRQKRMWVYEGDKRRQRRFWLGVGVEGQRHESEQTHAL